MKHVRDVCLVGWAVGRGAVTIVVVREWHAELVGTWRQRVFVGVVACWCFVRGSFPASHRLSFLPNR